MSWLNVNKKSHEIVESNFIHLDIVDYPTARKQLENCYCRQYLVVTPCVNMVLNGPDIAKKKITEAMDQFSCF